MIYQHFVEYGLVLIPILIILGLIMKRIPQLPNWIIPLTIFLVGAFTGSVIFNWSLFGLTQGLLCGGTAIGLHQLYKQIFKGKFTDCDVMEPDYEEEGIEE